MKKQNPPQSATAAEINPEIHGRTKREAQGIAKRYRRRCIDLERKVTALEAVAVLLAQAREAFLNADGDKEKVFQDLQGILAGDVCSDAVEMLAAVRGQKVEGGK